MYQCPGCGGNLGFDIASQRLKCKYCNTLHDPYQITKESDGYENDTFEVTYFACPQCGGEIYSTDNACAGFCSFCGASTVLSSRIAREKSPKELIPFKVTKEQCRDIYLSKVRKSLFAPRDMKNNQAIESFRGIYMPYWKYKYTVNGGVRVKGEKSHRSGDYIITDHYDMYGDVDAMYDGFTYDSSSAFSDNISQEIAPFDLKDSEEFTASMLSGFYADIDDVPSSIYQDDADKKAKDNTIDEFCNIPPFKGYTVKKDKANIPLNNSGVDRMLFPVWFMSYRNKNRVAYVTINGQTGKMSADIPVDNVKFLLFSLIMAIPIFMFLNILPVVVPSTLISFISVLALICTVIFAIETRSIMKKQLNEEDQGLNWQHKKNKTQKASFSVTSGVAGVIGILICVVVAIPFGMIAITAAPGLVSFGCFIVGIIIYVCTSKMRRNGEVRGGFTVIILMVMIFISLVISIISPVSDIFYYVAAILMALGMFGVLSAIMVNYNKLVTRRPPQFNKQGGDDGAY